jgi:DNA integrity scanning protein DisA with diadenylate cyclase activity
VNRKLDAHQLFDIPELDGSVIYSDRLIVAAHSVIPCQNERRIAVRNF